MCRTAKPWHTGMYNHVRCAACRQTCYCCNNKNGHGNLLRSGSVEEIKTNFGIMLRKRVAPCAAEDL